MSNETALTVLNGQTNSQNFSSVQGVGQQCVTCPDNRNTTEPCDITNLSLMVFSGGSSSQVDISCTRAVRGNNVFTAPDDKEKYQLARKYDGILEVVAPIFSQSNPGKGLFVTATMEDLSSQCPLSTHPKLNISLLEPEVYDELQQPLSLVAQSRQPFEVFAKRLPIDLDVGGINLLDVWLQRHPRCYEFHEQRLT